LPVVDQKPKYLGRLGKELDAEAGRDAAYTAALNVLAAAKVHLGSLDRVTRVVRLGVFIATSGDFFDQPRVADAVSDLFRDVFGIEKTSVRLVIGVASLPLGGADRTRCHLRSHRVANAGRGQTVSACRFQSVVMKQQSIGSSPLWNK